MFLALLKKEFKRFIRNKGNVVLLFLFPIVLITVLSAGLKDMMSNEEVFNNDGEKSIVYYTVNDNSIYKEGFNEFINGVEDSLSIEFKKTSSVEDVKKDVDEYNALAYINVKEEGFEFYSSSKGERGTTKIFKSIFDSVLDKYAAMTTISKYNSEAFKNFIQNKYDSYLEKNDNGDIEDLTSSQYYTFAELGLIILYISMIVCQSVCDEKYLRTLSRIRMSRVKEETLIASKVVFGTIISFIQTMIVYFYSTFALDVDWGENTIKFIIMFVALGLFVSSFSALLGIVVKDKDSISGTINAVIIVICFFGGSYCPLSSIMSIPFIAKLAYVSPLYWINASISSLLRGIECNAYYISLGISIGLVLLIIMIYFIALRRREDIASV